MGKVFITGATGQVGYQVAEYIIRNKLLEIKNPKDVLCLVRNPEKASKLKELGATIIHGSLEDCDTIIDSINDGVKYVFHVAGNILLNQTYEEMYIPNVLGTRIMIDAFAKSNAKCFVYTSSIAVYKAFNGKKRYYKLDETNAIGPLKGEAYPVTKRIAENIVKDYSKNYPDKAFIIARLGPIVGPGDHQTLPSLVEVMSYRIAPKFINGGRNLFSITSPLDVAQALVFLAKYKPIISSEAFNIAQEPISYRNIMSIIAKYYNRKSPTFSINYWFFKFILPFLKVIHILFPKIKLIKTALSPVTVQYIGRTYIYSSEKLKKLGFKYTIPPDEAILSCLKDLDPKKNLLK